MKLCCVYNVFDGIELLPYTIKLIRDKVDYIIIHYQKNDYYNNHKLSEKNYKLLKQLPVDELLLFNINNPAKNSREAKSLEKEKRNQALLRARQLGFDYYINSDADEFYNPIQFQKAKEIIWNEKIQYSYCHYQNYYKVNIRENKISKSFLPFICSTKKSITFNTLPIVIDPTRGFEVNNEKYRMFESNELLMLHGTGIRNNLVNKFESSTLSNIDRNNINQISNEINNLNENNLSFTYIPRNGNKIKIECELCDDLYL
jgi:hypothetical protein